MTGSNRNLEGIAKHVSRCAQLAALLEVSAWPKPGNVHRMAGIPPTRYEHFLASSVALGSPMGEAARLGAEVGFGRIHPSEVGMGRIIREAVDDMLHWQLGGNTQLGIVLLFVPLSLAAGKTMAELGKIDLHALRENQMVLMRAATLADAAEVYDAIARTLSKDKLGVLREKAKPSVIDKDAKRELLRSGISLFDALKASSGWDLISEELTNGMKFSLEIGYPNVKRLLSESKDINVAVVHTFLLLLSELNDTFIAREVGLRETEYVEDAVRIGIRKTRWISERAEKVLKMGGLLTSGGRRELRSFDRELRKKKLNPGSVADLTASSVMITLLDGLRF